MGAEIKQSRYPSCLQYFVLQRLGRSFRPAPLHPEPPSKFSFLAVVHWLSYWASASCWFKGSLPHAGRIPQMAMHIPMWWTSIKIAPSELPTTQRASSIQEAVICETRVCHFLSRNTKFSTTFYPASKLEAARIFDWCMAAFLQLRDVQPPPCLRQPSFLLNWIFWPGSPPGSPGEAMPRC